MANGMNLENKKRGCDRPNLAPIFVVGMPRSGTTLLSRLLSAHSNICIAPESHLLNYWMTRFPPEAIISKEGLKSFWQTFINSERFGYFELDAVPLHDSVFTEEHKTGAGEIKDKYRALFSCLLKQYAEKRNKPRWGEKTPAHYAHIEQLLTWYPNAQIIYMVRDPRSVAASMAKVPWGGNDIVAHALRWRDSIEHLQRWSQDPRVCQVRYEALATSPESSIREVCGFLREQFETAMLSPAVQPSSDLYSSKWAASHFSAAASSVNTNSLESWKNDLSSSEIALVEYLTKEQMEELGYEIVGAKPSLASKLRAKLYLPGKELSKAAGRIFSKSRQVQRNWA